MQREREREEPCALLLLYLHYQTSISKANACLPKGNFETKMTIASLAFYSLPGKISQHCREPMHVTLKGIAKEIAKLYYIYNNLIPPSLPLTESWPTRLCLT